MAARRKRWISCLLPCRICPLLRASSSSKDSELKANHPIIRFAQDSETAHIQHNTVARDLSGWLQRRVRSEYGAEIEPIAARALATVVGKDLRRADNELLKLVSYTNGERRITEADVALMTPYVAPANIFHMVDALATGKGRAAMHRLQELLAERERDPIMLFGMIIRQFRLLVLAKEHLESGAGDDMAKALRVHPFVAQKLREQAHRLFAQPVGSHLSPPARARCRHKDRRVGRIIGPADARLRADFAGCTARELGPPRAARHERLSAAAASMLLWHGALEKDRRVILQDRLHAFAKYNARIGMATEHRVLVAELQEAPAFRLQLFGRGAVMPPTLTETEKLIHPGAQSHRQAHDEDGAISSLTIG